MSEELIALAREDLEAFNSGDFDKMRGLLAPDSVYVEPGTGRRIEGPDAILEVNQAWKAAFPDAHGTITDSFACGDRVALQIVWEGTQTGALPVPGREIPPTGKAIRTEACQVMRIADGKVAEACHYFDMLGMMEQLGALSADAAAHAH